MRRDKALCLLIISVLDVFAIGCAFAAAVTFQEMAEVSNVAEGCIFSIDDDQVQNTLVPVLGVAWIAVLFHSLAHVAAVGGSMRLEPDRRSLRVFVWFISMICFVCLILLGIGIISSSSSCRFPNWSYLVYGGLVCLLHAFFSFLWFCFGGGATAAVAPS